MATYWVDPVNGDDVNPGSYALPWRTFNRAVTTAGPNDTVWFLNGTETRTTTQTNWNSGTLLAPLILRAAEPGGYTLQLGGSQMALFDITGRQYIQLIDLILRGQQLSASATFININNSPGIDLIGCGVLNTYAAGVRVRGTSVVLLENCLVDPNAVNSPVLKDAVQCDGPDASLTVRYSNITRAQHNGVGVDYCAYCLVENTNIWDTGSHCLSFNGGVAGGLRNATLRYSRLYNAGINSPNPAQETGIRLANFLQNVLVHHNDTWGNQGAAIKLDDVQGAGETVNVWHNACYNSNLNGEDWGGMLNIDSVGTPPNMSVRNNIFYHTQATQALRVSSGANPYVTLNNNLWYSTGSEQMNRAGTYANFAAYAAVYEPNSIFSQNPLFTNPGAFDFTLQAGSPAIDTGADLGFPYIGDPDIGAHEFNPSEPEPGTPAPDVLKPKLIHVRSRPIMRRTI